MSREVIEWLFRIIGVPEKSDFVKDFVFKELSRVFGLRGSESDCTPLRMILEDALKDEERRRKIVEYVRALIREAEDLESLYRESERKTEEIEIYV
ncbi:MAG: hypothetical protein ACTSXJ_07990 [Candidatus Baldrarchaeia archaeon]